ncbi:MAG: HD domain-containing protein [Dehalococcoidia bacterium]|nr:HD domain-containing protein [Dehalococcoidia bacterium]
MAGAALKLSAEARRLLADLAAFFRGRGVQAYVVGGFVRDTLLGRDGHDIDVSIEGDPLVLGRQLADGLGGSYFPLAEEQHVARVLLPERRFHIDLMPLSAEIEADLAGRDYTIDAMAVPLADAGSGRAAVIDPTGGLDDLRERRLRVIREDAFRHDALRPLRGVRLAVEMDFTIEPGTARLISKHAHRLPQVSVERQRDELMRIMATPRAGPALRLLDDLGLLEQLLPEVTETRGVEQPKEHYWDVFSHSLEAVRNLDILLGEDEPGDRHWRTLWRELWGQLAWWQDARPYFREELLPERPRAAVLKLAGLLHDIAKPETKTFDDTGRMRFFGHADVGARKCGRILRRLRFSAREVALVQAMVQAHLRPVQMGQQGPPTRRALYRYFRDCGDAAIATLFLSLADHLGTVGPRVSPSGWRQHVALVNYILTKRFQEEETISPPKLLAGDELMAELELSPGPMIGRLIETLREAQAAGEISTREEALALARTCLAGQPSGSPAGGQGG